MPGLMALRAAVRRAASRWPGARITGSLHMTIQTAVLIETLVALGAEVRWASCNIFSTQDHAAAAVVVGPDGTPDDAAGVPVFAWKGETLEEYWWCTEQMLRWPDGGGPNMILDDGGDATLLVHKGDEFERTGAVPDPTSAGVRGGGRRPRACSAHAQRGPGAAGRAWPPASGRHRGDDHRRAPALPDAGGRHAAVPGDQRQRLGDEVEVRQPLRLPALAHRRHQPGHRRDDRRQGRGRAAATATSARAARSRSRGQGARVDRHRDRPDLRAAGGDGGLPGHARSSDVVDTADIFITATGNKDIITAEHMARMKHNAIVGNIGHFDNEIDMAGLARMPRRRRGSPIKPQVDEWTFPDGHSIIVLAEGRLLNLGLRHRPPELRDVVHRSPTRCWPRSSCTPTARRTRTRCTCCRSTSTRRSPASTSTDLGVKLTAAHRRAGRLPRHPPRRAPTSPSSTATDAGSPPRRRPAATIPGLSHRLAVRESADGRGRRAPSRAPTWSDGRRVPVASGAPARAGSRPIGRGGLVIGTVAGISRYPVKSMQGEAPERASCSEVWSRR